ncbi:hypothetical protein N0V93_009798 [Gnomoniopsis smithogilvyi]|uniref:Rhodopsin domain-containing protein n=1 Tax=Gnomoniopsis smithogilvyi TaxID=1191159 RepID=A0A9W8YK96_9PEZI|nr:hypothetical protein N0V93_009798 [Gnomoniopsis smithogilvyi]
MSDVLAAMTPEQLAQTPAAMPPPGVKPNLVNPTSNAPVLIWTSSILMAVMFLFVAVRFYAKIALRRKLTGDDFPDAGQTWQQGFMNERYTKSLNMTIPIAAGSLFLDVYIFIIPLIAVMQLQLSHKKKMGVVAVFATGFVCMPTAAGFLKGKSNGWKGWSTSVVTIMRNLLRSDKRTDTSENFEGSWQSRSPLAKKNRSNYIDIEMEGSSTRELKISDHN